MSGIIPLPPGTQVFAVYQMEHETFIDGPLVGLALKLRDNGRDDAPTAEGARVLTLDPTSPSPGAQLAWFQVGVEATFSRESAEMLAASGHR